MAHQSHNKFRDTGFQLVFMTIYIGSEVNPFLCVNENVIFGSTALRSRLSSRLFCMSYLNASMIRYFKASWRIIWIIVS